MSRPSTFSIFMPFEPSLHPTGLGSLGPARLPETILVGRLAPIYSPRPRPQGGMGIVDERGTPPLDWVAIPAGVAIIGADVPGPATSEGLDEPPATVDQPAFRIARSPVTNAEYAAFTRATGHARPAHWLDDEPPRGLSRHPVTHVDWTDALAYCAWVGVRLPTEAEWEKAARGADGRRYPWGAARATPREANCGGWFGATTEVGGFPAGASPYGVLDMAGGVWEWTASPADASAQGRRVLRVGRSSIRGRSTVCGARAAARGRARRVHRVPGGDGRRGTASCGARRLGGRAGGTVPDGHVDGRRWWGSLGRAAGPRRATARTDPGGIRRSPGRRSPTASTRPSCTRRVPVLLASGRVRPHPPASSTIP